MNYINLKKKRLVGRNNQPIMNQFIIDYSTVEDISFQIIDDKNQIQELINTEGLYFAGSVGIGKQSYELLFLSKDYKVVDNIITFKVDTYTINYLNYIKKKNTEINIEIGQESLNVKKVILRDFALACPRVYVTGLAPQEIESKNYYTKTEVDELINDVYVPTKVSELQNDTGYITGYVETDPVYTAEKATLALKSEIPTKTSELENDAGYITGYVETDPVFSATSGQFELKSEAFNGDYNSLTNKPVIPTKTSELMNDAGYITGYVETDPVYTAEKATLALKSEIPTKTSELENDAGYITGYVETDPIFSSVSGTLATKTYVNEALNNSSGNNTGRIFSDPKFLYLNSYTNVSATNLSAIYTGVLGDNPPSSYINVNKAFYNVQPKELFFDMTLTYTAGDDFVLTPNDKLDMVIGSNNSTNEQIITCELYIDSILIRKGKIDYNEGFKNEYDGLINRFSLIKLNEIVDDKKITGNCLLEIKIKFYNGDDNISHDAVSIRQNTLKIFAGPNYINPDYYGLAKNLYIEDYYCYAKGLDNIIYNINNNISSASIHRLEINGDNFNRSLSQNYVYFMSSNNNTSELIINGFENNSMIVFNTDPNTDFTYSFTVDSWWKINKPFNFQKGKSYVIATEANCIFWNEVQNYE